MKLLIDIGNTRTKIKYETIVNLPSDPSLTVKDLVSELGEFKILGVTEVEEVIISSVVPSLTPVYQAYSRDILELEPLVISQETSAFPVTEETGADIICCLNAVHKESLIIMLGTATVFAYLNENVFEGVVIAPGVITGMRSMIDNAALLNDFEVATPKHVLGLNTTECLQSGMTYGHAAMIDGIISRIRPSINCELIAIGGFAETIVPLCNYPITVDQDLIFKGMENISTLMKKRQ